MLIRLALCHCSVSGEGMLFVIDTNREELMRIRVFVMFLLVFCTLSASAQTLRVGINDRVEVLSAGSIRKFVLTPA